jgi:hypothetical protein
MDKSWRHQRNWSMPPQGLVEHSIQVNQPWQVILSDCLVATDFLDFLENAILVPKQMRLTV